MFHLYLYLKIYNEDKAKMYSKTHPLIPLIQMAKSLVMNPDSIVSMQTDSRVSANLNKSEDSLSLAL